MSKTRFCSLAVLSLNIAFVAIVASACSSESSEDEGSATGGTSGANEEEVHEDEPHSHGGEGGTHSHGEDEPGPDDDDCVEHGDACGLVECAHPKEEGLHVDPCEPLASTTNPPNSGTHYSVWANFAIYDEPVPWGFLIHSIEHSGVVLAYNCDHAEDAGLSCDELRGSLVSFFDDWPADPLCVSSKHRLIVVPDPHLDVPFAATAWGHTLKGSCLDEGILGQFIEAHYGQNYENICNAGVDPLSVYPANCGE